VIEFADCKIREARQHVVAIDRAMIEVGRSIRGLPESHPACQEARRELRRLDGERNRAILDLEGLLLLDETPAGAMAQA
jgi:hypothetical protein